MSNDMIITKLWFVAEVKRSDIGLILGKMSRNYVYIFINIDLILPTH